jgi:hypothetical protein
MGQAVKPDLVVDVNVNYGYGPRKFFSDIFARECRLSTNVFRRSLLGGGAIGSEGFEDEDIGTGQACR